MDISCRTPEANEAAAAVDSRSTKRPLSAYFWFLHFARIAAKKGGAFNNRDFMSACAAKWRVLTDDEKNVSELQCRIGCHAAVLLLVAAAPAALSTTRALHHTHNRAPSAPYPPPLPERRPSLPLPLATRRAIRRRRRTRRHHRPPPMRARRLRCRPPLGWRYRRCPPQSSCPWRG